MSTDRPSIKGAIFQFAIEDLRQLVADGAISREELEARLGPGDADYLRKRGAESAERLIDRGRAPRLGTTRACGC